MTVDCAFVKLCAWSVLFRENEYLIKSCIGSFEEVGGGGEGVMRNPPSPETGISSDRVGLLGPSATLSF